MNPQLASKIIQLSPQLTILITPKIARVWLDTSTGNRKINKSHLAKLARDMANGKWKFSPQGIVFDSEGHLIDGHHRLEACIHANCSFHSLVFGNVPKESYDVLDQGKVRTTADVTYQSGDFSWMSSQWVAARANAAVRHLIIAAKGANVTASPSLIATVLKRYEPGLQYAVELASKNRRVKEFNQVPLLATIAVYYDKDPGKAVEFAYGMLTGADLSIDSPILTLRRHITNFGWKSSSAYLKMWKCFRVAKAHFNDESFRQLSGRAQSYDKAPKFFLGDRSKWLKEMGVDVVGNVKNMKLVGKSYGKPIN